MDIAEKNLRSCFIVDVSIKKDMIRLVDSSKNAYFIDTTNAAVMKDFKQWLHNVFMKGVAQTLTVFCYSIKDISECEVQLFIEKIFLNPEAEMQSSKSIKYN